jgi:GT2 family glycosyltransferase
MEADLSAPPVVAVVVTHEPGNWFEETLTSLADQDYPNLSVLVIDAASTEDPTARVAAILPRAFVRRLEAVCPYGVAANDVIGIVEGASHFLFCHDDVALAPDAIRVMVEEAFRSNAGVATPKLVDWDRPDRLLAVGLAADKSGVVDALVERGELDQEQHDSVRDVFVAPGAATLVRADLFASLGGFDPEVAERGEDLHLSWRAHLAGARVIVVPGARVRHLEASRRARRVGTGEPGAADRAEALADRNRIRTLLACYSIVSLTWMLPLIVVYAFGDAVAALLGGHPGQAARRLRNLVAAFGAPAGLLRSRRRIQQQRQVPDRRVRRLQSRGNARLRAWMRARLEGPEAGLPFAEPGTLGSEDDDDLLALRRRPVRPVRARPVRGGTVAVRTIRPAAGTDVDDRMAADRGDGAPAGGGSEVAAGFGVPDATSIGRGGWRAPLIASGVLLVLLIVGSRSLVGHGVPAVGQLPATGGGVGSWWRAWWSTWQPGGLGSTGPNSPALALLALAGTVCFGAVGTLQHVLVLGPLVVGPLGVYRASRWYGSQRGRLAALVAYALLPLSYNALAHGHWDGLLAYATAPWAIGMLGRLSDSLPYPATRFSRIGPRVLVVALLTAVAGAFVPSWILVVPVIGLALAAGSLLVGQVPTAQRFAVVGVAAGVGAFVLLLPWSLGAVSTRATFFGAPVGPAGRESFASLMRMHTGAIGSGPLGWGLLAAAALPLVLGRSWRLAWAARLWIVALVCVAWAWMGLRGWVPIASPEVVLAPAGAALAGSVGLGVVAFELDLPGYRFGWRQGASAVAAAGLLLTLFPVLAGAGGGHWNLPAAGPSTVLAREENAPGGDYRLLWVGAPAAIPTASAPLGDGQAWATSYDGAPDVTDEWPGGAPAGATAFRRDIRLAEAGLTTRLGHLLAPLGVRYIILPDDDAPVGSGGVATTPASGLEAGLRLQTDMYALDPDPNYTVYENAAWAPARSVLPASAVGAVTTTGATALRRLETTDLSAARPVLTGGHQQDVRGAVPGGSTLLVSAGSAAAWRLRVAGRTLHAKPAFGAALAFTIPSGAAGRASLSATPSAALRVGQLLLVAVWAAVLLVIGLDRRRRVRSGTPDETVRPEWFTPLTPARRPTRTRAVSNAPVGMDSDELWIDA